MALFLEIFEQFLTGKLETTGKFTVKTTLVTNSWWLFWFFFQKIKLQTFFYLSQKPKVHNCSEHFHNWFFSFLILRPKLGWHIFFINLEPSEDQKCHFMKHPTIQSEIFYLFWTPSSEVAFSGHIPYHNLFIISWIKCNFRIHTWSMLFDEYRFQLVWQTCLLSRPAILANLWTDSTVMFSRHHW